MPQFLIRARNSEYHTRDEGAEYDSLEAALAAGVQSAATMVADEVHRGHRSAAVEVSVEQGDGTRLLSSVVSISVSPIMVVEQGAGWAEGGEHS